MYQFKNIEQLKKFIQEEVLNTSEARELLGVSRARMNAMKKDGKITPVKELEKDSWYLQSEILERKAELEQLRKKYRPYDD